LALLPEVLTTEGLGSSLVKWLDQWRVMGMVDDRGHLASAGSMMPSMENRHHRNKRLSNTIVSRRPVHF
jgi:hypothetical protein